MQRYLKEYGQVTFDDGTYCKNHYVNGFSSKSPYDNNNNNNLSPIE